jgi:hypothetical protein
MKSNGQKTGISKESAILKRRNKTQNAFENRTGQALF